MALNSRNDTKGGFKEEKGVTLKYKKTRGKKKIEDVPTKKSFVRAIHGNRKEKKVVPKKG